MVAGRDLVAMDDDGTSDPYGTSLELHQLHSMLNYPKILTLLSLLYRWTKKEEN